MKIRLADNLVHELSELGQAIDIGRPVSVFDGGRVGFNEAGESEVKSNVAQGKAHRSPAGARPGQRARSRGAHAAGHYLRSEALQAAYGAEFRILAQHYEALAFEDNNGLWVVVESRPLGSHGPRAHFLVAFPLDQRIAPRAWAFERIGANVRLASLKHTNFPDASICAFVDEDGAWPNPDGILGLFDIFSIWMIKKWHRELLGWWPGKQAGACALYRRREFDGREKCGCESGRRYRDCHQASDLLMNEQVARVEFRRLFACDYDDRQPPDSILAAAGSRWKSIPAMASVFACRFRPGEPIMV